jgi:Tfp pilus assembly protein PilF
VKDYSGAARCYQSCLLIDPSNAAVHLNLALLYVNTGEAEAALRHSDQAIQVRA